MQFTPEPASDHLSTDALTLDPVRHEVNWDGNPFSLSALEFDLLHTLLRHRGQVLTREQLLNRVWGYDYIGDLRVVDTAVKRLRNKLRAEDPKAADLLVTVRAVGYKLAAWAHGEWVWIHPFINGNGRTARLWVNYVFARYSLPKIAVRPRPDSPYGSAAGKSMKDRNHSDMEAVLLELLFDGYQDKIRQFFGLS